MNGVINVYKPTGMTSYDVVHKVKKICNTKKVGHTGTLDPEASGVLPICIGRATKLVDYIMDEFKVYKAELLLGTVTDTYDREGKVIESNEVNVTEEEVIKAIHSFKGQISQIPPMYSALKVNGKKLYDLARKGIEIEREPRNITIYDIEILEVNLPKVIFNVKCSKGTYIRSLCYDIGRNLGCGGAMWNLERTATGEFDIKNSVRLEELNIDNVEQFLIPMDTALKKYERINIDVYFENMLINGVTLKNDRVIQAIGRDKLYRVYTTNNRFLGLGQRDDNGFKIVKLLI